jgi:rubrerythrin
MTTFYSPVEVIEMAIKTEQSGQQFYSDNAKKAKQKQLSDLFRFLAGEEEKHVKTFKSLYRTITESPQTIAYNFDDMQLYLKAITDSKFFLGSNKALSYMSKVKTSQALLDYALAFEKETMLFYLEITNFIKDKDKKLVDKIIAQEKEHIKKLSAMKEVI